jgi:predicted alpha/beta-fold hydrolase
MHAVQQQGWCGVVVHYRGCSGEPNRLPRAYHSGDSPEADWILRRLRAFFPHRQLFAVGVSLGGNMLAKWLGEQGSAASSVIAAAASVCAPLDLTACGHHLGRGFNRVYSLRFLHTLKRNAALKLLRFPGCFDAKRMLASRSLHAFDDAVTAPLHGFRGVEDYWHRASAKPLLGLIAVPTLILNARNDPFMPATALPHPSEVSRSVTLELPHEGGHVGFVTGRLPGKLDWLPQRLLHYFSTGGQFRP